MCQLNYKDIACFFKEICEWILFLNMAMSVYCCVLLGRNWTQLLSFIIYLIILINPYNKDAANTILNDSLYCS